MTEQQNYIAPQQDPVEDEIDIMEMIGKLLHEWKLILVFAVIAGVCGVVIAKSRTKAYTVNAALVPEVAKGNRGSGSGLSALAGLAGVNLNIGGGSDEVSPLLYPDIVGSTLFVTELFDLPVEFERKKETVQSDLYTYYKEYQKQAWWSYIISAPGKALGALMAALKDEEEVEGYDNFDPYALTKEQAKMVKTISKSISMDVDNKTGLISLAVTAQDPGVAFSVCNRVIGNLQAHVQTYRTEKARHDLEYYQQLYDEAKADYHEAQQKYARYLDSNQGIVLHKVLVERERLQNEANLAFQLYNTCAQQLQMAKATVQEEKTVCVVINPPTRPVKPSSMSGLKLLVIITFLGVCLACGWILFGRDWLDKFKKI